MSFNRDELIGFLSELDRQLKRQTELVVIGGASLTLAYNFTNTTIDMDLLNKITSELYEAIERAKIKTQLDVKVGTTRIYAEILRMQERLTPLGGVAFKNLTILVPEKHDLALMKCARSEARDIEDIKGLHRADPLDSQTLLQRFKIELLPLNSGDDELLKSKFLDMIETLFGENVADDFERRT